MDVTLEQFDRLVQESYRLADEIKRIETEEIKPRQDSLRALDREILEILNQLGNTSYKSSAGTLLKQTRYSVQTPKTQEQKQAYFDWLRSRDQDLYWAHMNVNSQTLNAFYKQEMEIAKQEGNFDFEIPGIGEPIASEIVIRRKK